MRRVGIAKLRLASEDGRRTLRLRSGQALGHLVFSPPTLSQKARKGWGTLQSGKGMSDLKKVWAVPLPAFDLVGFPGISVRALTRREKHGNRFEDRSTAR
jgi:hypothetical protein